jgi:cytochrome P450
MLRIPAMSANVANGSAARRFLFNPFDAAFIADPYAQYKRLRDEDPVHRSFMGVWVVSRYDHVRAVLKDARFRVRDIPRQIRQKNAILQEQKFSSREPQTLDALIRNSQYWLSFLEPPDHTRLRRLVTKAFHPRTVEGLRPFVRQCAERLIDRVRPRGQMDLMGDFARIFPMTVVARLLGLPAEDLPRLVAWTDWLSRIFDPLMSFEDYAELSRVAREFTEYFTAIIRVKRTERTNDLLGALIEARDEHDQLTDDELISICTLNFAAGTETTVNLLGNGTLALLQQQEALGALRARPEIMSVAVEELLRFDAPLQMTSRTAQEDLELGGRIIRAGEQVYTVIGAANRDPRQFDDADLLNLERHKNHHLSFADGRHTCLGAALARVEAQEGFSVLLEMLPGLRLADARPRWRENIVLRGMLSLPVTF